MGRKKEERGKFICFEGNEGSGKTTQAALLELNLEKRCKEFSILTREPSHELIGKFIRSELLSGKIKCDPKLINTLFAADRLEHIIDPEKGILGYLNNPYGDNRHVICDRYYLSSLAYYAMNDEDYYDQLDDFNYIWKLNEINRNLCKPDLIIFIDVDESHAIKRLDQRINKKEIYDNLETFRKIQNRYYNAIEYISSKGDDIVIIDGNGNINDIGESIFEIVCRYFDFKIK